MTNVTDFDPENSVRAARGITNPEVASNTILVRDLFGDEVEAATLTLLGGTVSEGDDHEAIVELDVGVKTLFNNSSVDLQAYSVVVTDPTADDSFTTTTAQGVNDREVGVLQQAIAAGASGPVRFSGYTPVLVDAAAVRGDFLETSTTAGYATTNPARRKGSFAVLTTGADPTVITATDDIFLGHAESERTTGGTSLAITMPTVLNDAGDAVAVPDGMAMLLALWLSAGTSPTITGWTRIGATANQYYFKRNSSSEPASYTANWTTSSLAVAAVIVLDALDLTGFVEANAYDATNAAAALAGLVDRYRYLVAGVKFLTGAPAGWDLLERGNVDGGSLSGSLIDLNLDHGTVTGDWYVISGSVTCAGGSFSARPVTSAPVTTPNNVRDGDSATSAIFPDEVMSGAGTVGHRLNIDLGAPDQVAQIRALMTVDGQPDHVYWSTDGLSWTEAVGTWSTAGGWYEFALTSAQIARYWRVVWTGSGTGFWYFPRTTLGTLELNGYAGLASVAGTLVGAFATGTTGTSPFTGTDLAIDALFALVLAQDPFLESTPPDCIMFGVPDVGADSVSVGGDLGGTTTSAEVTGLLGTAIAHRTGALSHPPTEAEVEAIIGTPVGKAGLVMPIGDTGTGTYDYLVISTGTDWRLLPTVRLLSGSAPPTFDVRSLTSAPEGGWSWFQDPRAVAHAGYTYVGYNQGGNMKIAVITGGAVVNTVTLHAGLEYDDHDLPTMRVRADGKLIAVYSKHVGANIYKRISTSSLGSDPTLAAGFAAEVSLSSGFAAAASTYPSLTFLSNVDSAGAHLFIAWRETVAGVNQFWYAVSTDDGDTFGGSVHLHTTTYTKTAPNGTARWDIAASDHGSVATKLYHAYRQAAAWHKSDGTTISASLPFAGSAMTTVYDAGTDHLWVSDICADGSGNVVIVFMTWPSNDYTDTRYRYATIDGTTGAIVTHEICAAGGWIPDTVEHPIGTFQYQYSGCVILDHADPQIVYASREISGVWEMFRYTTADGGATWAAEQLTTGSTGKNVRPISVLDAADIAAIWLYGSYNQYENYSLGLRGFLP